MKYAGKSLILGLFGRMISKNTNPVRKEWYLLFLLVLAAACNTSNEAETIVNQSIEAHGGDLYKSAEISFTFRERQYKIFKSPNSYSYTRAFTEEGKKTVDILNKSGFSREVEGVKVALPEEDKLAYTNSVNSVAYFAFLPYGLNDAAVIKKSLGSEIIEGRDYHLIKITFEKEGGGEDFEDEFLYWINKDTYLIDYLAYSYHTDGGGLRFRKAINTHEVSGLVLQDYENYKPEDESISVEDLAELFKNGELKLLSEILLEDIQVKFIN